MQLNRSIISPDIESLSFNAPWWSADRNSLLYIISTLDMSPQIAVNTVALYRGLTVQLFHTVGCHWCTYVQGPTMRISSNTCSKKKATGLKSHRRPLELYNIKRNLSTSRLEPGFSTSCTHRTHVVPGDFTLWPELWNDPSPYHAFKHNHFHCSTHLHALYNIPWALC